METLTAAHHINSKTFYFLMTLHEPRSKIHFIFGYILLEAIDINDGKHANPLLLLEWKEEKVLKSIQCRRPYLSVFL